ncbi:hypothetical protein N7451_003639 [Penicillium sp. IBT 35674x]|nr:hypothetical protein N7451_003639 [Penicillium sp. IBT 35674x]
MDMYASPEEASSSSCTDAHFLPDKTYSPESSTLPVLPGEEYRPESMNLCLLPANMFSPEGMVLCEYPESHSARSTDVLLLPAEAYVPDNLDLCLLPAERYDSETADHHLLPVRTYIPESADQCLFPAKAYELENEDFFLLPAKAYSPNSTSDYGCHVTPPSEDPYAHSNTWVRPVGPEEVAEYRNLAGCNPLLIDIDIEMADLLHDFMPVSPSSNAETPDKSPGSDESSIRALLNPESCSPVVSNTTPRFEARQSLIPVALNVPVNIDVEMADAMNEFMPTFLPSIAEVSDKYPDSDESSIRALLSPESCSPVFPTTALEIETHQSLIPAALNLPIKRGPENQPTLVNPGAFKRPRSQAASLRSVNSTQEAKRLSASRSITSRLSTRLTLSRQSNLSRQSSISLLNGINESNESARNSISKAESPNRKKLFGSDGWLGPHPGSVIESPNFEPPPMLPLKPTSKPALFRGLSEKFRKQLNYHEPKSSPSKSFTSSLKKSPSKSFKSNLMGTLKTSLQVSLAPSCQAKLYSDLEMMICTSANDFLLRQYYDGRISQYSVNKVLQQWGSKNRPQVYQFHFDQTTQRELILENRRTLDLNGGCSTNPMQFHSSMQSWKAIATEMSARTFCLPDNAIRKNLFEMQQILDMLSAPVSTLRELNDLSSWAQSQMVEASELSRSSTQSQSR